MVIVHGGFPQLLRIHFTKTFVSLDVCLARLVCQRFQKLFLLCIIIGIVNFLAFLYLEQRRLGCIHVSAFNERLHVPVEEGKQQRTDMGTVHIGIGHDDDLVIPEFFDVEIFSDTAAECGNHILDFVRV